MNEFIDECRREWRRLGVPDPVANEMAADLTADLEEAEAEGATPQDVLGNSAFDPRRFAAAWAAARGVTGVAIPERRSVWQAPIAIALAVVVGILTIGAALALLVGRSSSSIAFATRRIVEAPGRFHISAPGPNRVVPAPLGRAFNGIGITNGIIHPFALLLFLVGVGSLVIIGALFWSHRGGDRRRGSKNPSWN